MNFEKDNFLSKNPSVTHYIVQMGHLSIFAFYCIFLSQILLLCPSASAFHSSKKHLSKEETTNEAKFHVIITLTTNNKSTTNDLCLISVHYFRVRSLHLRLRTIFFAKKFAVHWSYIVDPSRKVFHSNLS